MATILLSAAGAAIGGAVGGTVAGLSSVAIGRAVGATLGKVIDQRVMGQGSEPVETGRTDRFRLTNAGEGGAVPTVFGRVRVGGQVIWASDFLEVGTTTGGGGKGAPSAPATTTFSYSVSLAIALCAGEILGVGRVWADGEEIAADALNLRVYRGTADQLPDPTMEAIEGAGKVPAYRGVAYVVCEDLPLAQFGNRVPQFSFEVVRADQVARDDVSHSVRAVAMMPGTGEYALATSPVYYADGPGSAWAANLNTPSGQSDLVTSLANLRRELPNCGAASMIVSWFGDDLRCGLCQLTPRVEERTYDSEGMPWTVSGLARSQAAEIARQDDRPVYGGTPADASVVEAIRHMRDNGLAVMFYPFILMDQLAGNGLPDPYSDAEDQPVLPWRGRITLSRAPGRVGTPDGTAQADAEVAAFFGTVSAADFIVGDGVVEYTGPQEWTMRRFILHYAALCAASGGVDSFCIGSEMRGLTQIRGAAGFAAVAQMRLLASEVRALVGPDCKIGYAADWSEYFGYIPEDATADRYFHLDPLWADTQIDFVGIDNYMPLSDWRDGDAHLDARTWNSIHDLEYLASNVEGGEGYDWYYHSREAADAQIRTEITDGAHDEAWIYRYKDVRRWWDSAHHERVGGERSAEPTDWVPQSKPIWFTELGCAAVDKGTNEPNRFVDPKSSESGLPRYSSGARDDLIQRQYLRAMTGYWDDPARNPMSQEYDGRMIDMTRAFVWAWDARPFPAFPNLRSLWSDGENHARGHWINGRSSSRDLASVVGEICAAAGLEAIATGSLFAALRGYAIDDVADARAALQPLMLAFGFDAVERDGMLQFVPRGTERAVRLDPDFFAESGETDGTLAHLREAEAEMSGRVRLRFVQADASHEVIAEEAILPDQASHAVSGSELSLSLTRAEARQVAERWLSEARISRDQIRFALPLSALQLGAGDVVELPETSDEPPARFRIDRVELADLQVIDAVRIEPSVYRSAPIAEDAPTQRAFAAPTPVLPVFLDLPLITGDERPHAPYLAVTGQPWPGEVAVHASGSDDDYSLEQTLTSRAVIGTSISPLVRAPSGLWDRGPALEVRLVSGALQSRSEAAVLGGANLAAIGDGSSGNWEVFQFRDAELVAPNTYWLRHRLRGQLGSDALMPDEWPAGSRFVLLDSAPEQIALSSAQRRTARHYRIGPAQRTYDDPSYRHLTEAFDGNGLRPYSPSHLSLRVTPEGAIAAGWMRRTRVDGDSWELAEVPLGEETEAYLVRVADGATVLREVTVTTPHWNYTAAMQAEDGASGLIEVAVAQVSGRFGPGPFALGHVAV
ncbi:MAG: glycoside hydrolase/phage tail family protein [Rhodobacteraceae bacterium]|nr:glycoside hydrolase/phage tail family protein [Paracoccaceae bacterium]